MARASMTKTEWDAWKESELPKVSARLRELLYALDDEQVLIGGERYLQSGKKLVLTGRQMKSGQRVIIKWSSDPSSMKEIVDEHEKRTLLGALNFSYTTMRFPAEIFFEKTEQCALAITEYVPQETIFIELPLKKQFFFALSALESQEGVHATTRSHQAAIRGLVATIDADAYLAEYGVFQSNIARRTTGNKELHDIIEKGRQFLQSERTTIARYAGFLTHTDFVPHNLRVTGNTVVILDHTSLAFGNKYESWARFINFMTVYNPDLERLLCDYVRENRGGEYASLCALRVFKAALLLDFHTKAREKATGDLAMLITARIRLWENVLRHILADTPVPRELIDEYKATAIRLRSKEERKRQEEISRWGS